MNQEAERLAEALQRFSTDGAGAARGAGPDGTAQVTPLRRPAARTPEPAPTTQARAATGTTGQWEEF
ncbi:MAG: hypothetical protein ACXIU8_07660, partial [Alkalilacustris sp.]